MVSKTTTSYAKVSDRVIGYSLVGGTTAFLFYLTLWVIVLPFVDEDQTLIHSWFPHPWYALGLPLLAGITGLAFIGIFVAVEILKPKMKEHIY